MNDHNLHQHLSWLREWQGRPQGEWLATALDVFEPIAPLGAQVLYILQPTMGWIIARERLHALAQALETPEGVAVVRAILSAHAEDPNTD
jgi:hypothetical protein